MFDTNADRAILADEMLKAEAKAMRRGMKRGLEKGMEKGMEKGLKQGAKQAKAKFAARDKKIEEFLRSKGVSPELLTAALAIK